MKNYVILALKALLEVKASLTKTVQASFWSNLCQTGKKITVMEIRLTNSVAIFVKPTLDENAKRQWDQQHLALAYNNLTWRINNQSQITFYF